MFYIKWVFILLFWGLIGAVFHYTLPQVDIARITDTYEKRVTPGANALFWARGDAGSGSSDIGRDVFFIQTRLADENVMVYRTEDTGWGWPPYFVFDTSNTYAIASDLKSTSADPQYVAIKHYGWRFEFLSIFPNAVKIWPVGGPDASKPLPWVNIIVLTLFAALFYGIWIRWRRFRAARIDPALEDIQDSWEATEDAVAEKTGRLRRWWTQRRG